MALWLRLLFFMNSQAINRLDLRVVRSIHSLGGELAAFHWLVLMLSDSFQQKSSRDSIRP